MVLPANLTAARVPSDEFWTFSSRTVRLQSASGERYRSSVKTGWGFASPLPVGNGSGDNAEAGQDG